MLTFILKSSSREFYSRMDDGIQDYREILIHVSTRIQKVLFRMGQTLTKN